MKTSLLLLLILPFFTNAQFTLKDRVKIEFDSITLFHSVTPMGESGILLITNKNYNHRSQLQWDFDFQDTNFNLIQSQKLSLHWKKELKGKCTNNSLVYFLFSDNKRRFSLVTIHKSNFTVNVIHGKFKGRLLSTKMCAFGEGVALKIISNGKPSVLTINATNGVQNTYHLTKKKENIKKVALIDIQAMENGQELVAYFEGEVLNRETNTIVSNSYAMHWNNIGERIRTTEFTQGQNLHLVQASCIKKGEQHYQYVGSYSTGKYRLSVGFFFCEMMRDSTVSIKKHPFLTLDQFLSHCDERSRLLYSISKKKSKILPKAQLAGIDLIPTEKGVVVYSEMYETLTKRDVVHDRPPMSFRNNSSKIQKYARESSGASPKRRYRASSYTLNTVSAYEFTYGLVFKLDSSGGISWNHYFDMMKTKVDIPSSRISVLLNDSIVKMVAINYSELMGKTIRTNGTELKTAHQYITNSFPNNTDFTSDIFHWYGNSYLIIDRLKQTELLESDTNNEIIYVSRVTF